MEINDDLNLNIFPPDPEIFSDEDFDLDDMHIWS